jgi:hypothetical protein
MGIVEFRLLALAAIGSVVACGGRLASESSDWAARGADGGTSSTPVGSSTGTELPVSDGGCEASPVTFTPPESSAACWSCVATGCAKQLAACSCDGACESAMAEDVSCVNGGGTVGCFAEQPADDDALVALNLCVSEASVECSCGDAPPSTTAACVQIGGGGGGGNGECTSNFGETCGAANYQVVCACPEGTCVCFSGTDTHVVTFDGCPFCPGGPGLTSGADMYEACGFPH